MFATICDVDFFLRSTPFAILRIHIQPFVAAVVVVVVVVVNFETKMCAAHSEAVVFFISVR